MTTAPYGLESMKANVGHGVWNRRRASFDTLGKRAVLRATATTLIPRAIAFEYVGAFILNCHPRESGDPGQAADLNLWIPAFAGMTMKKNTGVSSTLCMRLVLVTLNPLIHLNYAFQGSFHVNGSDRSRYFLLFASS